MSKICISLINFYQRYLSFDAGVLQMLAPGGACKYSPSCSEYTKTQIQELGVIRGVLAGIRRLLTCF